MRHVRIPESTPPRTVRRTRPETEPLFLSLDEAIAIGLGNTEAVRTLAGITAVASGRTIYDPAVQNAVIDQEQARFDPVLDLSSSINRLENPQAFLDAANPGFAFLSTQGQEFHRRGAGVSKTNVVGGTTALDWNHNKTWFDGDDQPLDPQQRSDVTLSYTQPLLNGAGRAANLASVVIARLDTERSFFELKDSLQSSVNGMIESYWQLVLARTQLWARRRQLAQAEQAYERELARQKTGLADLGDVAQTRVTFNQFRANVIAAEANLLNREAALRNMLKLPPNDLRQLVPNSTPTAELLESEWESLVILAEERRPDIIQLKLILEADEQRLLLAKNRALPSLDAQVLYRWNGLEGQMPNNNGLSTNPGQNTDWTLGVNFSVPLGLRQGRAGIRQRELILVRDRVNIEQAMHAAVHEIALSVRELDNAHAQYLAFLATREAALENLNVQLSEFRVGRAIFLNVLQALTDWGNAVSSEAQSLAEYNIALATLERRTGTILETHGVVMLEERLGAVGPHVVCKKSVPYPYSSLPSENLPRYPVRDDASENWFDLKDPSEMQNMELILPEPSTPGDASES